MSSSADGAPLPTWVAGVHALSRLLGYAAAALIVVSVLVVCQMVFVRAVLGQSSIWQTEFVTFAMAAATFLGAPYILLTQGHVRVDVVPLAVGARARRFLHLFGNAAAFAFCVFFLYSAVPWWHEVWTSGQTTSSIWRARLWIPYLAVPVGLAVLCLQYAAETWLVLTRRTAPFGTALDVHT